MQLNEIESASKELSDAKQAYKIIGNIMVLSTHEALNKELKEKKEMIDLRLKNFDAQEERLRKKAEELQEAVLKGLKKEQ